MKQLKMNELMKEINRLFAYQFYIKLEIQFGNRGFFPLWYDLFLFSVILNNFYSGLMTFLTF